MDVDEIFICAEIFEKIQWLYFTQWRNGNYLFSVANGSLGKKLF